MLFRGTQDGRVLAYDFKTGKRLWATTIADPKKGESAPAAPIAWNGLVFIGNAGGDIKGVKGRMYALDAKTGKIVWEFYLVPKTEGDLTRGPQGASPLNTSTWDNTRRACPSPAAPPGLPTPWIRTRGFCTCRAAIPRPISRPGRAEGSNLYSGSVVVLDAKTGAYKNHFKIVPRDWHDWDVSSAPAIIQTAGGKKVLSVAPKDGHLYGFDLATNALLYRVPVTRIENADATFSAGKPVHFCPGSTGGAEWNGPAYDPQTNLVYDRRGRLVHHRHAQADRANRGRRRPATPWSGEASLNPFNTWGKPDPIFGTGRAGSTQSTPTRASGNGG